jgi:prophage regulatory protein
MHFRVCVPYLMSRAVVSDISNQDYATLDKPRRVDPDSLLRLRQVLNLIPVAASTWWSGVRSGRFPKPLKLGPRTTCWKARDVLALIDQAGEGGKDR